MGIGRSRTSTIARLRGERPDPDRRPDPLLVAGRRVDRQLRRNPGLTIHHTALLLTAHYGLYRKRGALRPEVEPPSSSAQPRDRKLGFRFQLEKDLSYNRKPRSASSKTIRGDLPPFSSVTFFRLDAAAACYTTDSIRIFQLAETRFR